MSLRIHAPSPQGHRRTFDRWLDAERTSAALAVASNRLPRKYSGAPRLSASAGRKNRIGHTPERVGQKPDGYQSTGYFSPGSNGKANYSLGGLLGRERDAYEI